MRKAILLPASVGIALLLACAVALLVALASAPSASAASFEHGASFAVRCDFSHSKQVDPVVAPGGTSAHMHDFFGNKSTDASSTYDTMTASGVATTCSRPEDTGGYWTPTVSWKDQSGTHMLTSNRAVFYYRAGNKDYKSVQPSAKDLRIIADPDVNGARVSWYCGGGGSNDEKSGSVTPPTRCSGGVLGLRIIFPDCVAGRDSNDPNLKVKDVDDQQVPDLIPSLGEKVRENKPWNNYGPGAEITTVPDPQTGQVQVINPNAIDPKTGLAQVIDSFDADPNTLPNLQDHRLNMARSKLKDSARVCPSSNPIPLPTLTINANFPMPTTSGTVSLSSDLTGDAPGSSIHTDFWNTWDQDAAWSGTGGDDGKHFGGLKALVVNCINGVAPDQVRPTPCRAPTATS